MPPERAEEIDVARAQAARERALKRMANTNDPNVDWKRAEAALERAQVRCRWRPRPGHRSAGHNTRRCRFGRSDENSRRIPRSAKI